MKISKHLNAIKDRIKIFKYLKAVFKLVKDENNLHPAKSGHAITLQKEGIVVIENFINAEKCEELAAKISAAIEQNPHNQHIAEKKNAIINVRRSHDGKNNYDTGLIDIVDADYLVSDLSEIRFDQLISSTINEAAGQPMASRNLHVYVNTSVVNPRTFHIDTFFPRQYKSFIYLTDVNSLDDGPYTYIKKSHRRTFQIISNIIYNQLLGYPITDMRLYTGNGKTHLIAKKGTLIIACQNGFHRGWPQKEGAHRIALVNYLYPVPHQ